MNQQSKTCSRACAAREQGRALRDRIPRTAHATWEVKEGRTGPLELLNEQAQRRLAYLVPERYLRMSASPFAFYRGGALTMAADLAHTPTTGVLVQACGDAHLANFGGFASPERHLVFDINDFDETTSGPWEWDVKRLAASIEICGRDRGFKSSWCRGAVRSTVASYREAMNAFSRMGALDVWYAQLNVEEVLAKALVGSSRKEARLVREKLAKAYKKTNTRAFEKYLHRDNGDLRIAFDPPYLVPLDRFAPVADADHVAASLVELLAGYRKSLTPELQCLFDRYTYIDAAQKVVGVGSVGTRAWIVAFADEQTGDPLVLQVKEAQESVLERFAGSCCLPSHGERVVHGQRLMQASGDVLLGYTSAVDESGCLRDYYVRQLWDWKTSTDLETATPAEIEALGRLCGWTLARAHARSGDRFAIAGYLGAGTSFDRALVEFAASYADQNEADFRMFIDALSEGSLAAGSTVKFETD